MRRFRIIATAGVAALLATSVAACSSTSSSSSPSGDSDTLVVYSGRSESLVKPLYDMFTTKTGIKVEARYGDSAEMSAQIAEEGTNTPAQVFYSQDAGAIGALEQLNLMAPLPAVVATTVPAQYRSTTWTGVSARARSMVYNPAIVPTAPASVFDLTQPQYSGKVGIAPNNASFQSFVTAMRLTDGDAKTQQWLEGLMANKVQMFENNVKIIESVDAGKTGLGLVNHYYWYEVAKEKGAKNLKVAQEFTSPGDPGSLVNVSAAGLTASNANNENGAKFLQFLLSPEAQKYFASETFEYPVVPGIPGPQGAPPLSSLKSPPIKLNDLSDLPATQQMLRDVGMIQ